MKTHLIPHLALCALLQISVATLCAADPAPNPLAAKVNEQAITVADVTATIPTKDQSSAEARRAALEKLIDDTLLLQAAKAKGYAVPGNIVKERIDEIVKESFQGNRSEFEAVLKKQGMTVETFEKKQAEDILIGGMRLMIAKSESDPAAKKQAVATWLATARAAASIVTYN